jgi:hypothetical protein
MRAMCCVTYEIVTPESAERCDAAERGFVDQGEWLSQDRVELRLRDALGLMGCVENCGNGRDFREVDPFRRIDDASERTFTLHLPHHVTSASFERVRRLLRRERLLIGR